MGPQHRQYGTGICRVLRVMFSPDVCAMVGEEEEQRGRKLPEGEEAGP